MFYKLSIVLPLSFLVAGCPGSDSTKIKPDLSYAYMNSINAFRNSSETNGSLYYWDVSEEKLIELGVLTMGRRVDSDGNVVEEKPSQKPLGNLEQKGVSAVGFNINLPKKTETSLSAKLSSNFSYYVKENKVDNYKDIYSILSANYKSLGGAENRIDKRWKIRAAISEGDHLVVITNLLYTKDHLVSASFNSGDKPLKLTLKGEDVFSIDGSKLNSFKCDSKIEPVPCFFKVAVVDPYFAQSGNLDYVPASYSKVDLARAFRNQ